MNSKLMTFSLLEVGADKLICDSDRTLLPMTLLRIGVSGYGCLAFLSFPYPKGAL